jgi:hypothetical protein
MKNYNQIWALRVDVLNLQRAIKHYETSKQMGLMPRAVASLLSKYKEIDKLKAV